MSSSFNVTHDYLPHLDDVNENKVKVKSVAVESIVERNMNNSAEYGWIENHIVPLGICLVSVWYLNK